MKTKEYIELLFKSKGIIVTSNLITKFQEFVDELSDNSKYEGKLLI